MLEREFSDRTGFYPPADMYEIIESKYLEMDVDKDKFCEMYKNNDEDLAECIQMETDKATVIKFNESQRRERSFGVQNQDAGKRYERLTALV